MKRALPFLALCAALAFAQERAPTRLGSTPLAPGLEARVQRIGKSLRCAVCQGVSISDSPASMARAQLDKVRELVAEGQSDAAIHDYFIERYGEWVLMEPRKSGSTLLVWLLPLLLVLVGGFGIVRYVRGGTRGPPAPPKDDPLVDEVRSEVDR